jgi:hypothetical protein
MGVFVRSFYKRILPLIIMRHWKVVDDSYSMLVMEHELFRHIEIEIFVQRGEIECATELLVDVIAAFGGEEPKHPGTTESMLRKIDQWNNLQLLRGAYVHHYPICFRRILCDETLISMTSPGAEAEQDWYAISLISLQRPGYRDGFYLFADFVANSFAQLFRARCHWGKYYPLDRKTIDVLYPSMNEFRKTISRFDPNEAFKNDWFRQLF